MDVELAGEGSHADAVRAGCSHSVHFLVREPCSGSFLWFCRRADQRVVRFPGEVAVVADALIPLGNEPLDLSWTSLVPSMEGGE